MTIRWHKSNCKEDKRIYDTFWEAEVWAHSISNDIKAGSFDGYTTPDEKVASSLAFYLAKSNRLVVHSEKSFEEDGVQYKVWVSRILNF